MPQILPEWSSQRVMWTAWPSHPDLWLENMLPARAEISVMVKALAKGQRVKLLAMGDEAVMDARREFRDDHVDVIHASFGDIWLRDTGPIFGYDKNGALALCFRFNGWGGKYVLDHDDEVAAFIAFHNNSRTRSYPFVLEGGSVDFDGAGRVLTTKQCLLNTNRNPGLSQAEIEKNLREAFGVTDILWLEDGLMNDHTDGHIDNVARFVAPGRVVCMKASGKDDPNEEVYEKIAADLAAFGLEVVRVPSPGRILGDEGAIVPASHMNFIIGNDVVVMPSYEDVYAPEARAVLASLFPTRTVVAARANHVLSGGGSFHCITQQEPG